MITAQQLAEVADAHVVTPGYAASRQDWLEQFGISPKDITNAIIHEANALMRDDALRAQARIAKLNAKRDERALVNEIGVQAERAVGWNVANPVRPTWDNSSDAGESTPARPVVSKEKRKQCRVLIFGKYPTTAVIRWMGKHGWNAEDAGAALAGLGAAAISDITIKLQLKAGKEGERGEPAPLTKSEIKQVEELGRG